MIAMARHLCYAGADAIAGMVNAPDSRPSSRARSPGDASNASAPVDLGDLTTTVYTLVDAASKALHQSSTAISNLKEAFVALQTRLTTLDLRNPASSELRDSEQQARLDAMQRQLASQDGSLVASRELIVALQGQFAGLQRKLSSLESTVGDAASLLGPSPAGLSSLETRLATLEELARTMKGQLAASEDTITNLEQCTELNQESSETLEARLLILEQQLDVLLQKDPADALNHLSKQASELRAAGPASAFRAPKRSRGGDTRLLSTAVDRPDRPASRSLGQRPFPATLLAGLVAAAGVAVLASQLPLLRGGEESVESSKQVKEPTAQTQPETQPEGVKEGKGNSTALPAATSTAGKGIAAAPQNRLKLFCPQECWVEVNDGQSGRSLYTGMLKGPASFPLGKGLLVASGRADILKVRVNDGPVGVLDAKRQLSDRLILPPSTSKAGSAASPPPQPRP